MFHTLITQARDKWLQNSPSGIQGLLTHIYTQNKLRDAQVEAIKTYLYLKLECENKPLYQLFCEGKFSNTNLDSLPITHNFRIFLSQNPAALSLYEYALKSDSKLKSFIEENFLYLDYTCIFKELFYNASYTDYLFSLPMGAGKTYLMIAFIYIDLYFALSEWQNPLFAHNFLILAPSGLKNSILPSLKYRKV